MNFEQAIIMIQSAQHICVLPHISADGDSVGSSFALKLALETMGKQAEVVLEEEVQQRYAFVTEGISYCIMEERALTCPWDLAICVDCADMARLGKRAEIFQSAPKTILIDHHQFNEGFADANYIDTAWPAASMGIYRLLQGLGMSLTQRIATLLYVGLVTDTGGFRHSNTTPEAHQMAAQLLPYGISPSWVSQNVFDNMTRGRFLLNGEIVKRAEFYLENKVCICYLPEAVFQACGATEEDGEGLAEVLRNIEGVEVGVYVKDKGDLLKMSMRAKNYVDVASIAATFCGGGHIRAAGASFSGTYEELKFALLTRLEAVI